MMNLDNFKQEERTIDFSKVNLYAVLYAMPFVALVAVPYYLIWGNNFNKTPSLTFYAWGALIVISGIVIHELIHGLTWSLFAKEGIKSIKFGIIWKALMPYCNCKEPLPVGGYMVGGVMPAVILGFIPAIIALLTGNHSLFSLAIIFILSAGGDFMMLDILRKEPKDNFVLDHPTKVGCYIYLPLNGE
jgi:Putative zincin peptidase